MAEKKNQHFVPQFYLREFSYENNRKQIGIYNIDSEAYFPTAKIKFQAARRYYYGEDLIIENDLAELEKLIAPTIQEIIRSEHLPPRDSEGHFRLLTFLVMSFSRTTVHENSFNDGTDKMFKTIYRNHPDMKDSMDDFKIQFNNSSILGLTQMAQIIPVGLDLGFKLLINESNKPFITSDNPIVKYNTLLEKKKVHGGIVGLGTIGLQVFLSLSPDLMVIFYDPDSYAIGKAGETIFRIRQEQVVNDVNLLHFLNCEKIVFFDDQADESYIKSLHQNSKQYTRANQAIVAEHELRDSKGNTSRDTILHSRTTECRTSLNLPFLKILPKGRKYQPTTMAHIREFPKQLIKAGLLGPGTTATYSL